MSTNPQKFTCKICKWELLSLTHSETGICNYCHLYKERNGDWPKALYQKPSQIGNDMSDEEKIKTNEILNELKYKF